PPLALGAEAVAEGAEPARPPLCEPGLHDAARAVRATPSAALGRRRADRPPQPRAQVQRPPWPAAPGERPFPAEPSALIIVAVNVPGSKLGSLVTMAGSSSNLIEVRDLVKRYKKADRNAVDGVSFGVRSGEFFSLLGPNGAGKTTTISILTTT